uniref:Membrane protein insertase YidC n=1 Tax=Candidatus Kentrum sp. DK TaxID=2126562 RepID=A0A450RYI5_9GAMM|nr:MAG: protein translocase subunit yidC [Candidatus Kentron sp. DK]VFJ64423.1 MAG: protein translocase subunit yidC [Candidatus Kentron sp. DK]
MPIEQIRTFLSITLLIVLFLLWQAWQEDYGNALYGADVNNRTGQGTAQRGHPGKPAPSQDGYDIPLPPGDDAPVDDKMIPSLPGTASGANAKSGPGSSRAADNRYIHVRTDVFDVLLDPDGTGIHQLDLLAFPESQDDPDVPFQFLSRGLGSYFIAEAPLYGSDPALHTPPKFHAEQQDYRLAEGEDSLQVKLVRDSENGLDVTKVMTFRRGSYVIDVSYEIENTGDQPVAVRMHGRLTRYPPADQGSFLRMPTYTGGVLSNAGDIYRKIDFSDMAKEDLNVSARGGWIAMIQHYFIASWIPDSDAMNRYYTNRKNSLYTIGVSTDRIVQPGSRETIAMQGYIGPKIQDGMEAAAPNLSRTVDYGWLWMISEPLFWLLGKIHAFIGNWGVAIIILTLLIKLVFFHLSATSYKSMARMRKLQPRMMKLRDTYKDDKVKMNQRLMELYKEEKVNPVSGCLPIAVQIPVFIALYWVLLESVELRHAGFLWLTDLSAHDPFFILPISMGVTMFLQQKLNPTPPDPVQAKVMMALPFVFTVLFLFFPSGLVLYWLVNNVLSIAQQWVITKQIAPNT